MTKKYPRSEALQNKTFADIPAYISWDGVNATEKSRAFAELNKASDEFTGVQRAGASYWSNFSDLDTNVSSRPGLSKSDYYRFRPGEAPPSAKDFKAVMRRCSEAYYKIGLIRNIIDLMGDFACQGIRVVHPNQRIQKFFQHWFEKIHGSERSERFCNNLFRTGNVVVRKQTAKVTAKVEENLYRSSATPDMEVVTQKVVNREIPFKYIYLEPSTIDIVGGPLASMIGQPLYAITLPAHIRRTIITPRTELEKQFISQLPADLVNAARSSSPYLLPQDKTKVFHYKKDDWQIWAFPMIYSLLDDIAVLEKLRLADMAALDGAISNIRIFKLGNLEYKIMPTSAAAQKLAAILQNNVGGGTIDLIWGPDIELVESNTNVHQFLGEEKYRPHLSAVYNGLGIPPSLTGGGGTGTTNNFISLKTLIQRLRYAREVLLTFWNSELADVQKAMGFRLPPVVEFDVDILDDDTSVRALLIQLADRNLISDELLQYRFGHNPDMESLRIQREEKERETGKKVEKAGPYHDPQFGIALKKVALQTGAITPGQVGIRPDAVIDGLKMYDKMTGEKTALEMRVPVGGGTPGGKGTSAPAGRPKNSKDTKPRKTKVFKPKLKASVDVWFKGAQNTVAEILNPLFLKRCGKQNMRQLTTAEDKALEKVKFGVLFNLEPLTEVNSKEMYTLLGQSPDMELYHTYQTWANDISQNLDRPLTLDEYRQIQIALYNQTYIGDEDVTD